jgi:AraC-like DNA-binding protein
MHNTVTMPDTIQQQLLLQASQILARAGSPPPGQAWQGVPSHCPGITLFQQHCGHPSQPALYQPGVVMLLSGEKHLHIGSRQYTYNSRQGLVMTSPFPALCQVDASAGTPLVGLYIALQREQVATLLAQIDHYHASLPATVRQGSASGISLFEVSPRVQQATTALLATLADPLAARLFGDSCTQALLYALLDQETIALHCRQWVAQDGQYARFIKATAYIQSNLATALAVPAIARHAGLSESSLNRAFKRYAADTPLQYIKKVRLNQAHTQLQSSSCTIQHAAHAVGYESVSQFSRDYKRYFGSSPRQHRHTPPAAAPAQ